MITKQAYLNLAAVDDDFAAEMEKVALSFGGLGQRLRSGVSYLKNKFGGGPAKPYTEPAHPNMGPRLDPRSMRRETAIRNARGDLGNYIDQKVRNGVGHVGTFLENSVTAGQARAGWNQVKQGLGVPGKTPMNQRLFNRGLVNMAAGAGKTGLLYGGAGYGGYRLLRGDPEPEVASMYHQAMPY